MTPGIRSLVLMGTAFGLSACTAENSSIYSWNQPAGAFIDEGGFGNATMRNTRAMTQCVGRPKGYILPDPVVVLDPGAYDSPKSPQPEIAPRYRNAQVRCSGDLNGKYAEVIFQEYVDSATELPPNEQSGLAEIAQSAGG